MHHPGPPRFTAVGADIDLAPREPDPEATYQWSVVDAPADSTATVGDDPVVTFTPDVPGVYRLTLTDPEHVHHLTVRAFPTAREEVDAPAGGSAEYAFAGPYGATGEGPGERPRVRLDARREGEEVVFEATPQSPPNGGIPDAALEVVFQPDDRDDLAHDALAVDGRTARLPIDALDGRSRVHAVAVGERHSVADAVAVSPDGDGIAVERLNEPPAWATEMTLYEIYLRSFAPEADDTFGAIVERLDRLESLGVDCIWLTPILANDGWDHGYNIVDFFAVAEDLGDREDFERFVDACHERGIRVLFDLVLNHTARDHPFFHAATDPSHPEHERYREWYEFDEDGEPASYFDWEYVVNLETDTLEVRRHLLEVVDEWAPYVDGFRCDMAWALPTGFWQEIRERVKTTQGSDFLLLDETIPYIAEFNELCFDVHFDTTLYFSLRQIGTANAPAGEIHDAIEGRAESGFPDHAGFLTYIENHDETRYIEDCGRDATLAAAGAMCTLPGIPLLYAGQAVGERERRNGIDWAGADEELEDHSRDLLALRAEHPTLGHEGDYEPVDVEAGHEGIVAYARRGDDGRYVVVLNFAPMGETVRLPGESVDATDLLSGADVREGEGVHVEDVVVLESR